MEMTALGVSIAVRPQPCAHLWCGCKGAGTVLGTRCAPQVLACALLSSPYPPGPSVELWWGLRMWLGFGPGALLPCCGSEHRSSLEPLHLVNDPFVERIRV